MLGILHKAKQYLYKLLCVKLVNVRLHPEAKAQYDFVNCLRALSLDNKLNCVWFSVPNEIANGQHPIYGHKLKMLGKISGVADMVFMWRDGCGCIEFKSEKGKQTEEQKYFEMWCKDQGVDYRLARSKGEALAVLMEWGVIDENQRVWIKYNQIV